MKTRCLVLIAILAAALAAAPIFPVSSAAPLPPPVAPEPYPFSTRYPVLIALPGADGMRALTAMRLDLGGFSRAADGTRLVQAFVSPEEAAVLREAGFDFVPIPNQGYRSFLEYGPESAAPIPWPTFEQFVARMQALADAHPAVVRLGSIGTSLQGRALHCLQISDNPGAAEDEPEFRYLSTIHGDETTGVEMTLRLAELLAAGYGADPALTALVDGLEIWICPIYNPDGYAAGSRYNANGVDLNRDYPDRFTDPADDPTGREPETQAFMAFGAQHRFVMGANYHGGALVLNYPWDAVAAPEEEIIPAYAPDNDLFYRLGYGYTSRNPMLLGSKSFEDGLTVGWEWYQVYGGLQDWAYLYRGEHHVTIEVSLIGSPQYAQMDDYWQNNREAMLWWMGQALSGVGGRVLDARDGAPLDALVSVEGMDMPNFARTDAAVGDYHRVIGAGDVILSASAEGYLGHSGAVRVVDGALSAHDFYLCPAERVALQGSVTQAGTGLPLAAVVELLGSPISALTDALSGGYSAQVCPAQYTLRASAAGHLPEERVVEISDASRQDFALLPAQPPSAQRFWLPIILR